jgi:hypothetical protein
MQPEKDGARIGRGRVLRSRSLCGVWVAGLQTTEQQLLFTDSVGKNAGTEFGSRCDEEEEKVKAKERWRKQRS